MKIISRLGRLAVAMSLVILPVSLTGCAQQYATPQKAAADACSVFGPRATSGALIGGLAGAGTGALVGGLVGHNATDAIIGAAAGGLLGVVGGTMVGHNLDHRDCAAAQLALQQLDSTPTGQNLPWTDPSTGSYGSYTPTAAEYTDPTTNQVCRPVSADYYLSGHKPVLGETGNVCRDQNGDYHMQTAPSTTTS